MKSPHDMSTEELVSYVKSQGYTPQTGYGQFVKHRTLRPEISMKQFLKIWGQVSGAPLPEDNIPFSNPTHVLKETFSNDPKLIVILESNKDYIKWVDAYGTGGTPRQFIERLELIDQ